MSGRAPCSACGYPFRGNWQLLSSRAGASQRANAFLCPRCGMGQGPAPKGATTLRDNYKHAYAQLTQEPPQRTAARRAQSEGYLRKMASLDDGLQCVVELRGAGQNSAGHQAFPTTLLDPNASASPDPNVIPFSLRAWAKTHTECVDLLLSTYLLEYLEQPRAHLRAIARALRPTGKARIEVRNLCSFPEQFETSFLDARRPNIFSPHSLTTMCSHAGLTPLEIDIGETITLVCRRALDHEGPQVFSGPSAAVIARRLRQSSPVAPRLPAERPQPRLWS